jgi:hypothetical protein
VPPDVSGLSKREARLVKNRAAAFLSRQRKREEFESMEMSVPISSHAVPRSFLSSFSVAQPRCRARRGERPASRRYSQRISRGRHSCRKRQAQSRACSSPGARTPTVRPTPQSQADLADEYQA